MMYIVDKAGSLSFIYLYMLYMFITISQYTKYLFSVFSSRLRLCAGFKINKFFIFFIKIEFDYLIYYLLDVKFLNIIIAYKC